MARKKNKKKVFVDSSILITALLSVTGGSFYVLTRYREELDFFINEYVLDETVRVIRKKFAEKDLENTLYLLIGFSKMHILSNPEEKQTTLLTSIIEKEDTPILASAFKHADILLTLDNDFLAKDVIGFVENKDLHILKPADLIATLKEK